MSSTAKLTAEQIENLAKEIREFLLEHGLWQDVDIYFNGKRFTQHDPVTGKECHFCPIPVEVKCQYGFRENGCKKCLLKHTELLDKPRED